MPVFLQSCIKYSVNVVVLQSGTRFPRCLLDLPSRLKKRSTYDIYEVSFMITGSCSFALVTLTIGL